MEHPNDCNRIEPMTIQESYSERRKLFKDIWETAMSMNKKDNKNILQKPKIIKTLRLDIVDQSAGKNKKQRISNLRTVCKRLLEFCDRQEADDIFYQKKINSDEWKARDLIQEPNVKKRKCSKSKKIKAKGKNDPSLSNTKSPQSTKSFQDKKYKPIIEEDNDNFNQTNETPESKPSVTTQRNKINLSSLKITKAKILERPQEIIMLNRATDFVIA